MSQAAASIHVLTTHAATAARAATKADSEAASASGGVDFSALLAGQLGTSVEGLKAIDSAALPQEEREAQPDLAEAEAIEPSAQADALAALGIPAIHPNAHAAAVEPMRGARDNRFDGEQADADVDPAAFNGAPVVTLAEVKRALPAELAAASELSGAGAFEAPVANGAESAATPVALPNATAVQALAAQAPRSANPTEQPIAMGRADFADQMGNRLTWMAANGKQEAEIRLDPPHLGPLELRLSINGDQASLSVVSAHAAVRDAVQNSVSRLQDMMQAVGVNLGQVFVGQGSQDQQSRGEFSDRSKRAGGSPDDDRDADLAALAAPSAAVRRGSGLVDVFA